MPKPKKEAKDKSQNVEELYHLEPLDYQINNLLTSIDLLASKNEEIRLRSIGRLYKCLLYENDLFELIIKNGLYQKFLVCFETENVYILRYALTVWRMFSVEINWNEFNDDNLTKLSGYLSKLFLESEDLAIKNLSIEIIFNILLSTKKNINFFGTIEMTTRLFDTIPTTIDLEIQNFCLEIFYVLLETVNIQDFLLKSNFSVDMLLCFVKEQNHPLKSVSLQIINKISNWNLSYLQLLFDKKIMEVVTNLMIADDFRDISYEILMNMLNQEGFDLLYVQKIEFLKFLEWCRYESDNRIPINVVHKLTKNDQLHQILLDIGIDEILLIFIQNYHENILANLLESIQNLSRHMYMCFKMTNVTFLDGLITILSDPKINKVPYGEFVLKTLFIFFKCNPITVQVVCTSPKLDNLLQTFYIYSNSTEITQIGFLTFLELIQFIVRSKFVTKLLVISFFKVITTLFHTPEDSYFEKVLKIVEDIIKYYEFRTYFIENNGLKQLFERLNTTNYSIIYGLLLLIKYLIRFKKTAYFCIDNGLINRLMDLDEMVKSKTDICKEILDTLYDLCLTIKFFHTNHLTINNKIRDQFYLMPQDLKTNVKVLNCDWPIYVVLYGSILKFKTFRLRLLKARKKSTTDLHQPSTARCLQIVPSFLAIKFAGEINKELNKDEKNHLNVSKHRKKCEDEKLSLYIREVYEQLHFRMTKKSREEKIAYVAKYVASNLNDFKSNVREMQRHELKMHLVHLKDALKSNFIPIGYLRKGLARERALLFKVICDQVDIPTTLNRHENGILWNGVSVIKSNPKDNSDPVISVDLLVDLMANIGEMIPVNTSYCDKYFEYYNL